mmetsp:Transcript_916/g.3656  ORF Transcript_916/g.3656 Transcript_916/m.3656 type:complete len:239 (-) Transcript_916:355-1071(-)
MARSLLGHDCEHIRGAARVRHRGHGRRAAAHVPRFELHELARGDCGGMSQLRVRRGKHIGRHDVQQAGRGQVREDRGGALRGWHARHRRVVLVRHGFRGAPDSRPGRWPWVRHLPTVHRGNLAARVERRPRVLLRDLDQPRPVWRLPGQPRGRRPERFSQVALADAPAPRPHLAHIHPQHPQAARVPEVAAEGTQERGAREGRAREDVRRSSRGAGAGGHQGDHRATERGRREPGRQG